MTYLKIYFGNFLLAHDSRDYGAHLGAFKLKIHWLGIKLYRDLSYGEILAGRPGAWLVKKIYFICMQSKKLKKELMLKFKIISRICLMFMLAFKRPILMFVMVAPTLKKTVKPDSTRRVFKLDS